MNIKLVKAESRSDIASLAELAREIWRQHFTPIIGASQVEYMLEKFQSVEAITSQLENGAEYYIACLANEPVGYTGLVPDVANKKMMINKIYLRNSCRGIGIGGYMLNFVEQECKKRKLGKIWLTVNRFNHGAIEWYSRKGFETVNEVKQDIGNGFFMDDYIMEKRI
ncbi:MAG: GNAT family N-acetyltransferase [Gammaproteobacteria bacterium]|nr:GNAT family N-acetyltransferase [Gammaproteobacteria bacterium]